MATQVYRCRAILTILMGAMASNWSGAATSAATQFAGNLLQNHVTLLEPEARTALDEINRELREADSQLQRATESAVHQQAIQKQADATHRLVTLLERSASVHRFVLKGNKITPSLSVPFSLPSDEGGFLFRVESGSGTSQFFSFELDQARTEHAGAIEITRLQPGVTWVLMGFFNLPVGRTSYPLEIGREGEEPAHAMMTVTTPHTGRVKITALDDDDGVPTPVMMRITSKVSGRDHPPSNSVDFSGQFEGNGNASSHRKSYLFGRLGGEWWVVPGPFEMALPPGDYELALRRGAEHLPIFDQFTVTASGRIEKTYRPRRWVDMRKLGWYSGDDHIHARIMSDADAERIMTWVRAEDVHVANIVKMGDIYRTYFEQRGWGKDYRVVSGDYILSPGQESPRTFEMGHTLSLNTTSMVYDTERYYLYDGVADTVHAQGGLFGYAHVGQKDWHVDRDMSINIPKGKIDFAEVMQYDSLGTQLWYDFLNLGFKLTGSAGSDVPWAGTVGEVRVYAYLGDEPFSVDAWFEAVRRGRTFVTNGPMIEFQVDDALPGDEIQVRDRKRLLRVRARAWGHPDRNVPTKLTILKHGEMLREATAASPDSSELSLDFTVTADDGFWIAARVDANDGSAAHTTPIYVTRSGLRFWKYAQVQELLDKRLHSLTDIENLLLAAQEERKSVGGKSNLPFKQLSAEERADFEQFARTDPESYRAWKLELDDSLSLLSEQGPELLKRARDAKQIYEHLSQIARRESALRGAGIMGRRFH